MMAGVAHVWMVFERLLFVGVRLKFASSPMLKRMFCNDALQVDLAHVSSQCINCLTTTAFFRIIDRTIDCRDYRFHSPCDRSI